MTVRCTRRYRLRPGVSVATGADGRVALLLGARRGEYFGVLNSAELAMLQELGTTEHTEAELLAKFGRSMSHLLDRLCAGGWLTVHYVVTDPLPGTHPDHRHGDRSLITIRPLGPHREPRVDPPLAPRLSRFALLRRDRDALVLESPLCRAVVLVHDLDVLTMLHRMARADEPCTPPGLSPEIVAELVTELAWYGFVHDADEETRQDLSTEQWSPHELWFHSRSRAGYHDQPLGGTLWATEKYAPLPGRREPWAGALDAAVSLPAPDTQDLPSPPLGAVLEARRSVREPDEANPLSVAQLGEFLYWAARVRRVGRDGGHEVSLRPSPSAGGLHGLEIYPVVRTVTGLAAGMYHYDPFAHRLEPVPAGRPAVEQLLTRAAAAADTSPPPHVLLVISARFGRVMWKYQGMAYALILKDLGALLQTMYLVATAMDLAPCALGTGDSDLFAQATGLNPLVEASVGEFMLSTHVQ